MLVIVGVFWWLWICAARLGAPPVVNKDGSVVFDEFLRAKDILIALLPLLTLALGYWFGSRGTEKAEEKADDAKEEAKTAKDQVVAIVGASDDAGLLSRARADNPGAFGLGGDQ